MTPCLEKLKQTLIECQAEMQALNQQQSDIEAKLSDCYHVLELQSLNAVQMMTVTKRMKETLVERRKVKDSLRYYHSTNANLKSMIDNFVTIEKNIEQSHAKWVRESRASKYKILNKREA